VIGHRGTAMHAPENTMESIRLADQHGADAVEFDVRASSDAVAMVIHDEKVDRTTDAVGRVGQFTAAELQRFNAGCRFSVDKGATSPFSDKGVRIPRLSEVLEEFPDTPFVIEIKEPEAQGPVIKTLRDLRATSRVVLGSFAARCLREARAMGIATGAARMEVAMLYHPSSLTANARSFDFQAVFLPRRYFGIELPLKRLLRVLDAARIPLHTWVENDAAVANRLWKEGIAGVVSDDVAGLRKTKIEETVSSRRMPPIH
jgi:glycerophosphoryl diester phosphodiesterase